MRSRAHLRRLALPLRFAKGNSSTCRAFTQNTTIIRSRARPQLPFLGIPLASRQQFRYLTTERKQWIKHEVLLGIKYTLYIWALVASGSAALFAYQQEWQEREHPTPHEWSFLTRFWVRGALCERERKDVQRIDHVKIVGMLEEALKRLEHEGTDGAQLREALDAAFADAVDVPEPFPEMEQSPKPFDIREKSEEWRRGYYETLLAFAKESEHVDGYVLDKTRGVVFPPDIVVGPSNPRPKPIAPGASRAPREEDCQLAFPRTDDLYAKLLNTAGLTTRQTVDTFLAYASWLEFKGEVDRAEVMLAMAESAAQEVDPATKKPTQKGKELPSANTLNAQTAMATFKARNGDVQGALAMMATLLKARRSLPEPVAPPATHNATSKSSTKPTTASSTPSDEYLPQKIIRVITSLITPPAYPPPPSDGRSPPSRDPQERCEEAALALHIGEIYYASRDKYREDGLDWTREAIDVVEEQLHRLGQQGDTEARATCRQCLAVGLQNWATMAGKLAREEEQRKREGVDAAKSSGWLGLWGAGAAADNDRWAAEEKLVAERTRRARDLLEDLKPPSKGLSSILYA